MEPKLLELLFLCKYTMLGDDNSILNLGKEFLRNFSFLALEIIFVKIENCSVYFYNVFVVLLSLFLCSSKRK